MPESLQSLGAILRDTREGHALTLEEVEARTRIRKKYLQAIEAGDFTVLPSPAHARGFLRNYAQFLGLDASRVVQDYDALNGMAPATPATYQPPSQQPAPRQQPPTGDRPGYVMRDQQVGPGTPMGLNRPPAEQVQQQTQQQPAPYQQPQQEPQEKKSSSGGSGLRANLIVGGVLIAGLIAIIWAVVLISNLAGSGEVVTAEDDPLADSTAVTPSPTFEPTSTPESETFENLPTVEGQAVAGIIVEQRTWVRISVDGTLEFEGDVQPGQRLGPYQATNEIYILASNGAGLNVTFNGQAVGPLGERGEAVEYWFTPDDEVLRPTTTATVTATPTGVPTSTPTAAP